jgi:hypothetical protein
MAIAIIVHLGGASDWNYVVMQACRPEALDGVSHWREGACGSSEIGRMGLRRQISIPRPARGQQVYVVQVYELQKQ